MKLSIYTVTFNDGGWHESLPTFMCVALSKSDAIEHAKAALPYYSNWSCYAVELQFEGYDIIVKNSEAKIREDKINEILN